MTVDPEKIEQQLADMVAGLAPYSEGSAANNVVARMQMTVVPAYIRWKAGEANRGSDENGILNAFVLFVSSQMVGTICETVGSSEIDEAHFALANRLLRAIGDEVGSIMTGGREMVSYHVPAEQIGRA